MTRLKSVSIISCVLAVAAVSGIGLGKVYGEHRARAKANQERATEAAFNDRILREQTEGIAIGQQFPELAVWSIDGRIAVNCTELLPTGGAIYLFSPGCGDCVESLTSLQRAADSLRIDPQKIVILADREEMSLDILDDLQKTDIRFPYYCDVTKAMRDTYRVRSRTAVFTLDASGNVSDMRAGQTLTEDCAPMLD